MIEYINGEMKQINMKNRTYFYNDIMDLDEFDGNKIKVYNFFLMR